MQMHIFTRMFSRAGDVARSYWDVSTSQKWLLVSAYLENKCILQMQCFKFAVPNSHCLLMKNLQTVNFAN